MPLLIDKTSGGPGALFEMDNEVTVVFVYRHNSYPAAYGSRSMFDF